MITWHDEQLSPTGKPENVSVTLQGISTIKYHDEEGFAVLTTKLTIYFSRDQDTIPLLWRATETKLWNKEEASNFTESDIAAKFQNWIVKFNRSMGNIPFKLFVVKCAVKAPKGISTWILSLR